MVPRYSSLGELWGMTNFASRISYIYFRSDPEKTNRDGCLTADGIDLHDLANTIDSFNSVEMSGKLPGPALGKEADTEDIAPQPERPEKRDACTGRLWDALFGLGLVQINMAQTGY